MKNYQDSDYALNKHSAGIVYRFADRIMVITLGDYLAENPGKSERDFLELKALSDGMYLEQDRSEYRQTWKNTSIHRLEDDIDFVGASLEEEYAEACNRKKVRAAFVLLMESGDLTQTQERRFLMCIRDGLSLRGIAAQEGVALRAIQQSIYAAMDKLKKYFNHF